MPDDVIRKSGFARKLARLIGKAFGVKVLSVRDLERFLTIEKDKRMLDRRVQELESSYEAVRLARDHALRESRMLTRRIAELEAPSPPGPAGEEQHLPANASSEPNPAGPPGTPAHYPFPRLPGVDPKWLDVSIVDVGAQPLDFEGDIYEPMLHAGQHSIIGFDPFADPAIAPSIGSGGAPALGAALPNVKRRVLPYFLGNGNTQTFHVNRFSPTSSLFPSNVPLLAQFMHLAEVCATVREIEVATRRLDDIVEIERCDFLKVDVQGGDYDVIAHGLQTLDETLFVHIEAEFAPIYKGQPLFRDIDRLLQGQDFELIDFVKLGWNTYRAMPSSVVKSRLLWADCIYMKSPARIKARNPNLLFRAAYIAHANYRKYDLAAHLIDQYDLLFKTDFRGIYVNTF